MIMVNGINTIFTAYSDLVYVKKCSMSIVFFLVELEKLSWGASNSGSFSLQSAQKIIRRNQVEVSWNKFLWVKANFPQDYYPCFETVL